MTSKRPSRKPPRSHLRRYRSHYVIVGGAVLAAMTVYGFSTRDDGRTCVDANRQVIDSDKCRSGAPGARWYFGGAKDGTGKMFGGSYERAGFGGHGGGGG